VLALTELTTPTMEIVESRKCQSEYIGMTQGSTCMTIAAHMRVNLEVAIQTNKKLIIKASDFRSTFIV
jgi:hypothetical protein